MNELILNCERFVLKRFVSTQKIIQNNSKQTKIKV